MIKEIYLFSDWSQKTGPNIQNFSILYCHWLPLEISCWPLIRQIIGRMLGRFFPMSFILSSLYNSNNNGCNSMSSRVNFTEWIMLTLIFDSSTDLAFVGKWMGLQTKMRYEQLEGVKKVKKVSSIWSDTPSLHRSWPISSRNSISQNG
jgi:hypothetical protein